MIEEAGATVRDITGQAVVTFREDGTTTTSYNEWTTVVVQDGAEATMVRNGEDAGNYTVAADGTFTMSRTELDSVMELTMNLEGEAVTMTVEPEPSPVESGTLTCEGDTRTVAVSGATSVLPRES